MRTHLWRLHDLPLRTDEKTVIWLFSFLPFPSHIHIAIGVTLGVSVKEFVGGSSHMECFLFSGGPCKAWHLGTLTG